MFDNDKDNYIRELDESLVHMERALNRNCCEVCMKNAIRVVAIKMRSIEFAKLLHRH